MKTNSILILILIFLSLFSKLYSQEVLKIYINHIYWDGREKKSISPNDTLEVQFSGLPNYKYLFHNFGIEIVLRKSPSSNKEKRMWRREQSQTTRIKQGPAINSPESFNLDAKSIRTPSQNLAITIPCNIFKDSSPLSRVIIHINGIDKIENNTYKPLDNRKLQYSKSDFNDGFSFWRGQGFE